MATANRLETSVSSGISGIKEHMKTMNTSIKEKNAKSETTEQELHHSKQNLARVHQKKLQLKDEIVEKEEDLRKISERVRNMSKRLEEKEMFLQESKKFHRSLKQTAPQEGSVEEHQERLKFYKDLYAKNHQKQQRARDRKIELEQQWELLETKSYDTKRRLNSLETDLEYNKKEEERRTIGCMKAIDAAHRIERTVVDYERSMDPIMRRKESAMQKINALEAQISRVEANLETLHLDRQKQEMQIKEYLMQIRSNQMKFD